MAVENRPDAVAEPPFIPQIGEDIERLAELRRTSMAVRSKRGIEVLRYRSGVSVLEHSQLEKGASFQRRLDDIGITKGTAIRERWNEMLVTTEGTRRRELRMPFANLLRGPHMKRLQRAIGGIVHQTLDEIDDPAHVDLMADLAWKVPSRVYCHLVSAPLEQAAFAARLSDSTLAPILTSDASRRQETIDAFNTTHDFVKNHLAARRKSELGEDFTSIMIRQFLEGQQSEEEMIFEGIALLQASVDNTVHQIALALGTLLDSPDRWAEVVADEALIQPGIEESMRLQPRFGTIFRYAPEAIFLDDLPIPPDTWVFISLRSANRDETMFGEPDTFRFDRGLKRALQFGGGPYSCLGQTLARVEIQEVVQAIRERFPGIRLTKEWTRNVTNAVTEVRSLHARLY